MVENSSFSSTWSFDTSKSVTTGTPFVSVPVLSNATVLMSPNFSR